MAFALHRKPLVFEYFQTWKSGCFEFERKLKENQGATSRFFFVSDFFSNPKNIYFFTSEYIYRLSKIKMYGLKSKSMSFGGGEVACWRILCQLGDDGISDSRNTMWILFFTKKSSKGHPKMTSAPNGLCLWKLDHRFYWNNNQLHK